MKLNIKLLESNDTIYKSILEILSKDVDAYMLKNIDKLKSRLPQILNKTISDSPEYISLMSGQLKYEFGIPDPGPRLAGLIDIWINNIQYEYKKPSIKSNKIIAGLSVNAIRIDFADVLYTDYALVIDGLRGYSLPWLEWLLLEGNKTIVSNYEVIMKASPYSRTGNAFMKESNRSWSVPNVYSGTANNNWITRAIDNAGTDIDNLLKEVFES